MQKTIPEVGVGIGIGVGNGIEDADRNPTAITTPIPIPTPNTFMRMGMPQPHETLSGNQVSVYDVHVFAAFLQPRLPRILSFFTKPS